jgi:excisionase family DNA binding protein
VGVDGAMSAAVDGGSIRETLTVEQAAQRLGISRSTAYECVRSGLLPSLRFRRRIVIPAVVIDRLLHGFDSPRDVTVTSGDAEG